MFGSDYLMLFVESNDMNHINKGDIGPSLGVTYCLYPYGEPIIGSHRVRTVRARQFDSILSTGSILYKLTFMCLYFNVWH